MRPPRFLPGIFFLMSLFGVGGGHTEPQPQVTRREYIEGFITLLGRSPSQFRRDGAWALGGVGATALRSVPSLVARLSDRRGQVRRSAMRALVEIGPEASPQVRRALFSPNIRTRWLAAQTLGGLGSGAKVALGKLQELSLQEDEDLRVRRAAWRARRKILGAPGFGD
jgi:HEAT repeat protein